MDRVIHCQYHVVCWMVANNMGKKEWKKYYNTYGSRRKFQIDLAIDIINYGLALDWDKGDERPSYVRKDAFIPCDCKICLFCKRGVTGLVSGVPPKGKK